MEIKIVANGLNQGVGRMTLINCIEEMVGFFQAKGIEGWQLGREGNGPPNLQYANPLPEFFLMV